MIGFVLKRSTFLFLALLLPFAAGCQPVNVPAPVLPSATVQAASLPAVTDTVAVKSTAVPQAETTPVSSTTADPLANCPREAPGLRLYANPLNGLCFLYPDTFTIQPDELRPQEVVNLVGPQETPGPKQMELATVHVYVASNGPADVSDSAAYAQKWRSVFISPQDPVEINQASLNMDGIPAVVLNGLPGMIQAQTGFVVANDYKYTVTISPQPGFVSELNESVTKAWETVTSSIVFFPPLIQREVRLANQVCPQAAEGTKRLVQEAEGYCFLYPADFETDPAFSGRVEGGPNLGNSSDFQNVHVSLTLGAYPLLASDLVQAPREILALRLDVDLNSVQDRTFGGARAVVFKSNPEGGPWASRQAIIVTNEKRVYTIVNDPWEPERWPESMAPFAAVWQTVTGSLTFFTPWN